MAVAARAGSRRAALTLVVGLALLGGWWLMSGDGTQPAPQPSPGAGESPPSRVPPPVAGRRGGPAVPSRAAAPAAATSAAVDDEAPRLESPLETYRRFAVYPPDSRRLHPEKTDLIDWNRRHETARRHPEDPALTTLFTADRYHLVGDQTLSPVLTVERAGAPATAQIIDSQVHLPDGRQMPYALTAQGEVYVGLIRPADYGLERPVKLVVEVVFDAGPGPTTARLNAMYVPEAAAPARFTGQVRDAMVDGSLIVSVELDVATGGLYLIDANLYGPEGETIAWTRHKPRLEPGVHQVPLRFFGKVLVDAGVDGPYTVGQLRAALAAPDQTPSTVWVPPFEGEIVTATYRADGFSDAEWDAPEKRDRIRRLSRLEAAGGAPRIGRPQPPE